MLDIRSTIMTSSRNKITIIMQHFSLLNVLLVSYATAASLNAASLVPHSSLKQASSKAKAPVKGVNASHSASPLVSSNKTNVKNNTSAVNEPPNGRVYFGAWLDTADTKPNDGDRPVKFNQRMGFNASFFQYAQDLPVPEDSYPFPQEQIFATNTDALILLTVYPKNKNKPWNITDEQILTLVNQLADLEQKGKRIWLRFAPENNGNWNEFGQQPSKYIQLWERVYKLVKQGTKKTALVWSPSFGTGYPYGGRPDISPDDLKRLDTNGNGVLDKGDDPYSPYYPGDEFVDWVGISIYNFGLQWPWIDNAIAAPGKFEDYYKGFYDKFSKDRKKPCMISEHAAAFHIDSPNGHGVGELAVKQSWWRQYLTNHTFWQAYPNTKAHSLFEYKKKEESTLRDFRISSNVTIRQAFLEDMKKSGMDKVYIFANETTSDV